MASPSPVIVSYVLDPLERAANTFVQQFVTLLIAGGTGGILLVQNWAAAADTAGFAALTSLILSVATFTVPKQSPVADLIVRVLRTFASSIVGTLTASGLAPSVVQADFKGAIALAIPVAFAAFLKGIAALANPLTDGASLIPLSWRDRPA